MLRFLLNGLWFVLGGFLMGIGWWLAGILSAITIVGLPWAGACFRIGTFSFRPFGLEAVSRSELTGETGLGSGPLGFLGNLIWFLVAGWWLALGHLASALACAVTVIGLPFAVQCLKIASFSLWPFGRRVVKDPDASRLGVIGAVLWFVPGVLLALAHVVAASFVAMTIIGFPFALQGLKLAGLALQPFGKTVERSGGGARSAGLGVRMW